MAKSTLARIAYYVRKVNNQGLKRNPHRYARLLKYKKAMNERIEAQMRRVEMLTGPIGNNARDKYEKGAEAEIRSVRTWEA